MQIKPCIFGLILIMIISCKKDNTKELPIITILPVTNITATNATSGGEISSDGGAAIISRGICWGINPNPTIADSKTENGNDSGNFTCGITGLTPDVTYYVRAYAINSLGTAYSSQATFTSLLADIDGNVYTKVTIGTQVWMVENLKTTHYRNGDPIPNVTNFMVWFYTLTSGAYTNYANDATFSATYGRIYNWYAVNDSRNIAPLGWHVPTEAEWATLTTFLGGNSSAATKLKEAGTSHWLNTNAQTNNSSGFTALPGGDWNSFGFVNLGNQGEWWTSTEKSSTNAYSKVMYSYNNEVTTIGELKSGGISVRCIKD